MELAIVTRGLPVIAGRFTSSARGREAARRARLPMATRQVPGLSVLEAANVLDQTLGDYRRRMAEFVLWCQGEHNTWTDDLQLDALLVSFFDVKYMEGAPVDDGCKTMAALQFMLPAFARRGSGHLPRANRALRSWRKHGPSRQRLPLPFVLLVLVLEQMLAVDQFEMAVAVLLQHKMYLRPGELASLLRWQLVPPVLPDSKTYGLWSVNLFPQGTCRPGKTGVHDESLVLDNCSWLGHHLSVFQRGTRYLPLWSFPYSDLCRALKEALQRAQLSHLGASL